MVLPDISEERHNLTALKKVSQAGFSDDRPNVCESRLLGCTAIPDLVRLAAKIAVRRKPYDEYVLF